MVNLSNTLKEHNINPSQQRIKILQYIVANPCHPTVDQIFIALHQELPTLSKATIYNTLRIFEEAALVRGITIEGNEVRYESNTGCHGHFKCRGCGSIYDFDVDIDGMPIRGLAGFKIESKSVYFKGMCKNCLLQGDQD